MYLDPDSLRTDLKAQRIKLVVEHADEKTYWDVVPSHTKVLREADVDVCEHINMYWAQLDLSVQQQIFEIYNQIQARYEQIYEPEPLIEALRPLIKKLYDLHKLSSIEAWMKYKTGEFYISPVKFKPDFVLDDMSNNTREKTYTQTDYFHLIALALALRPMIPIWGEFIKRTQRDTGTQFKEFFAYLLLTSTEIPTSIAVGKLLVYLEGQIKNDDKSKAREWIQSVDGLGTEYFHTWLLAGLLITRICVGDVRGSENQIDLAVSSYKYITLRVQSMTSGTGAFDPIREKKFQTSNDDGREEQATSPLEAFKIKEDLPYGAVAPYKHFLSQWRRVAVKAYAHIDMALLELLVEERLKLRGEKIWDCQVTLAQWTLARVMSPRALGYFKPDDFNPHYPAAAMPRDVRLAIAIAQTILWQRGHQKLAALMTASANTIDGVMQNSGLGTPTRIPPELQQKLIELYPYETITARREKTKPPARVFQAIESMVGQFSRDWILRLPDSMTVQLVGNTSSRRYACPPDIRVLLAKLVYDVGSRTLTAV
jgi:hypothetical protein